MKTRKRVAAVLLSAVCALTNICTASAGKYDLPEELADIYPYRVSQTAVKYAPWFTVVGRASSQSLQNGTNAGENCQVTGTIAFSDVNTDHVIAGFDTNTVAISTDGGLNWFYQTSDEGTHACMTAFWHPTDENTVYKVSNGYNGARLRSLVLAMAENKGLYRSRDCGKTWEKVLDQPMATEKAGTTAKFDEQGNLYALTNNGLFKSTDDGDTWEQLNDLKNWIVYDLAISQDGQTILTGTANGLYASLDGGKTWSFRNGKQFYGNVSGVDIDPLDENHWVACFYRPYNSFAESYDKGKTWSAIDSNFSYTNRIFFGGIMKDGSRYMYAVGQGGLGNYRYSKDNGVTWQYAKVDVGNGKNNIGSTMEGIALSRKHPEIVWAAFGDGINRSLDGGIHFENRSGGHGGQKCYFKIVTDSEGRIHFPGTDTGYFSTVTAYENADNFPACTEPYRVWGEAIALSPHNPKHMLLAGNGQGDKVIYESFDTGKSWRERTETLSETGYTLMEFHNKDKNVIYTNQSTSYDGGKTWKANKRNVEDVSKVNSDVLLSKSYSTERHVTGVKISTDRGETWQDYFEVPGSCKIVADRFDEKSVWCYSQKDSAIYFFDGEELKEVYRFENLVDGESEIICFAQNPKDKDHILAGVFKPNMDIGYGIAESFDGGENWHIVPGNPGNGWITMICFEERTNDIFVNSYCGLMVYDSDEYRKYMGLN